MSLRASLCWLASSSALLMCRPRGPVCGRPRIAAQPLACLDGPVDAAEDSLYGLVETVLAPESSVGTEGLDGQGARADAVVDMLSEDELQYGRWDDMTSSQPEPYAPSAGMPWRRRSAEEEEEEAAELAALLRELDELEVPSYAAPPVRKPPEPRAETRGRSAAGRRAAAGAAPPGVTPAAARGAEAARPAFRGERGVPNGEEMLARAPTPQRGAPRASAGPGAASASVNEQAPEESQPAATAATSSRALQPPYAFSVHEEEGFESAPVSANAQLVTLIPTR